MLVEIYMQSLCQSDILMCSKVLHVEKVNSIPNSVGGKLYCKSV